MKRTISAVLVGMILAGCGGELPPRFDDKFCPSVAAPEHDYSYVEGDDFMHVCSYVAGNRLIGRCIQTDLRWRWDGLEWVKMPTVTAPVACE